MTDSRAGQPAGAGDLVNVAKLVTAYYTVHPDPRDPAQRVSFGTSGHRGSAFTATFNEDHILAATQAICDYRAGHGIDGPLYLGADTHALAEPAQVTALEVLAANGVRVLVDSRGGYTPTPAVSRAILAHNLAGRGAANHGAANHGGRPTGSWSPPRTTRRGRRLQVQPARRGPGRDRRHQGDTGPGERTAQRRVARRAAHAVRAGHGGGHDRDVRFPRRIRGGPGPGGRPGRHQGRRDPHRRGPARRGQRRVLGRDRRALRPRPHRGQPRGGPDVPVHDPGLGRQDPDGLLFSVRDGQPDPAPARVHHRDRERHRLRPARHRHAGRRAAQSQPLPRRCHRLPVPAPGRLAVGRGGGQDAGQLVDDRPGGGGTGPGAV